MSGGLGGGWDEGPLRRELGATVHKRGDKEQDNSGMRYFIYFKTNVQI